MRHGARADVIAGREASLRRLATDRIDLHQLHNWDGLTPLEETLGALDDLVRAGKVRYVLTGKATRGAPAADGTRLAAQGLAHPIDLDKGHAIVDALRGIGADHGASVAQVALRWLMQQPAVASVIIGARTEQLADNLGAAGWELSGEELARLDDLSRPPLIDPHRVQQAYAADRLGRADGWPGSQPPESWRRATGSSA